MDAITFGSGEILVLFIALSVLLLPVVALVDIIRSNFPEQNSKLMWVVIVLLLPFLGSILYLAIGRKQKIS